jgi:hypothetical protein
MGFPHGFNTRILQIAAIDEQIELCEQELLCLAGFGASTHASCRSQP